MCMEKKKKDLNEEQKPWAVVMYEDNGVDYCFFDTQDEADTKCDANVALGYASEVVNCQSAARRQAIEWVNDKMSASGCYDVASLEKYFDDFAKSGLAIYKLGEADKKYVVSMIHKSVEDLEKAANENLRPFDEVEVEIDEDDFNVRLHTATKVMEACLAKSDMADLCSIAESLEEDGFGVNLVDVNEDEDGFKVHTLRINRFAAAMAKSLCHAVLDSFNEEED